MSEEPLEQKLEELEEITQALLTKTTAFQAVITCLLRLSPPLNTRRELLTELEKRFKVTLASNPEIRAEIRLILSEFFDS